MALTFQTVHEYGIEPAAALLTEGFAGYVVPIQIPPAGLLAMVRQDSVDLNLSCVALEDNVPIGAALIARRGWTSRLAAMSIVPQARGRGLGTATVRELVAEARARGDKGMTLEAIEQNIPAVRLYGRFGFRRVRRLVGFVGQPQGAGSDSELEEADIRGIAHMLITHPSADLPWQLSGETLAQIGPPYAGYRSGASYIVLSNPAATTITIRAIVTLPEARRRGSATNLLRAVAARHPGKAWRVSATFPEELGGLFQGVGMTRDPLSQWQMSVTL